MPSTTKRGGWPREPRRPKKSGIPAHPELTRSEAGRRSCKRGARGVGRGALSPWPWPLSGHRRGATLDVRGSEMTVSRIGCRVLVVLFALQVVVALASWPVLAQSRLPRVATAATLSILAGDVQHLPARDTGRR